MRLVSPNFFFFFFLSKNNFCDTFFFSLLAGYFICIPRGHPGKENHIRRKEQTRRSCVIFIQYMHVNQLVYRLDNHTFLTHPDMSSAAQYLGYVLLSFGLANYLFHRIPVCARKEQVDCPDEMV